MNGKEEFYFLHSYHIEVADKRDVLTSTDFAYEYVSAIEKENIFGVADTQFYSRPKVVVGRYQKFCKKQTDCKRKKHKTMLSLKN